MFISLYQLSIVQPWCATKLEDDVTDRGNVASWAYCGPDCPIETNAWKTDDTPKITHHRDMDQKQKMMSARLIGIMSSSFILLALMMKGLGMNMVMKLLEIIIILVQ